ncbi:Potassium voltage-gated channel protein Shab [Trachymyrmex septentrionalis]|uniref:Potassium voltage-gated channel protein Shab n=1 Tax=Trachymyrmex septentrionalis TaxID=34720 RepID=A0A195FVX2_9HYME|nr:Potassium voltage-gated channel protein Shab [Trachymyrmex septentrionalis]
MVMGSFGETNHLHCGTGHNMSGVDGNSTEGESACGRGPAQTGPGCYRNYEHYSLSRHRRSTSNACFPNLSNDLPTTPNSPNRRLLDFVQNVPSSQNDDFYQEKLPAQHVNQGNMTSSEYKDFTDPENIMPLATSDFRNPVCQEMRSLRFNSGNGIGGSGAEHLSSSLMESKISPIQPLETLSFASMYNEQEYHYAKTYNEQGSIDSSDTYASCQTHPSHSQGDLTEDADSNLYINPLEATEKFKTSQMKKSISGEVGRNIIAKTLPSAESLKEASKVNLNDMMPKHRKIRIQQSIKPRTQFISDPESMRSILKEDTAAVDNNNHYGGLRGGKPSPLMSTNSLASATRIINYHMFGSLGASKHYRESSVENKLSLSADSIDSGGMPFIDQHRISKSILKKSDSGNNYYSNAGDSDTEKLITDSMSTASICDNETSSCDASANTNNVCTKKRPMSPLFSRQVLESIFLTNNNIERECTSDKGDKKVSVSRKSRILFSDIEEEKHARDEAVVENQNKELDDQSWRSKIRVQEQSKETMLILRPYKTKKSMAEEKKKTNKLNEHSSSTTYKMSDANYFSPKYNFSS